MPFPIHPPTNFDSPSEIIQNDWDEFRCLDYMGNHWDRPGWQPGRRSYHWMLTFGSDSPVADLASYCQAAVLGIDGLDLSPIDSLHLTIGRIGFTDQVSPQMIRCLLEDARSRLSKFNFFTLAFGPIAGSPGALRFSVSPWTEIVDLVSEMEKITAKFAKSTMSISAAEFRPHLSIAYSRSILKVPVIVDSVVALRALEPVEVEIEKISLVELRREDRAYRHSPISYVHLRHPALDGRPI